MARSPVAPLPSTMLWVGMPIIRNTVLSAGGHAKGIAEICAAMDIAVEDLDDAEKRISLDQGIAGIVAAIRVSGDPFLALHLGERTNVSALGLAGLIMESSKDALAVLRCAQEFTQAFTNVQTFMLETLDHEVHFHIEPVPAWTERSPETAMFVTDTAFASLLNQLYLLTRKRITPLAVHYRQPRPVDTTEHERILRCRPEFDREANRMIFAIDDLRVPVLGHNKPLSDMLRNLYEEQVRRSVSGSFSEKVKQVVFGNMQVSFPSLEVIAEVLNMTPRTLQRKLSMEGTSFRAVTDALKQELAENLLANPALTIADIAYKLGYFEPTSFQRAFRQWTGTTPMEYRKGRK